MEPDMGPVRLERLHGKNETVVRRRLAKMMQRSRPGPASSSPACTSSGVASVLIPLSATTVSILPAAAATRGRLRASESGPTLLCPQSSRAPTSLGESQTLPEAPKTLQDLPGPLPALPSYFSPPCSLCSTHRGPLTLSPTLQVQSCPRTFALALSATRMLFRWIYLGLACFLREPFPNPKGRLYF